MGIRAQEMNVLRARGKGAIEFCAANWIATAEFPLRKIDADDRGIRVCGLTPKIQSASMAGSDLQHQLWSTSEDRLVELSDLELRLHRANTVVEAMSTEQKGHGQTCMCGG